MFWLKRKCHSWYLEAQRDAIDTRIIKQYKQNCSFTKSSMNVSGRRFAQNFTATKLAWPHTGSKPSSLFQRLPLYTLGHHRCTEISSAEFAFKLSYEICYTIATKLAIHQADKINRTYSKNKKKLTIKSH